MHRCAELGILVDLSHLNEARLLGCRRGSTRVRWSPATPARTRSARPRATSPTPSSTRSAPAAASSGSSTRAAFLRPDFADDPDTPLALIAEHARYVADRIGVEHVALGSDFDGATIPAALEGAAGLPRLLAALGEVGFSAAEVEGICWRNWRRVLDACWH